MIIVVAFEGLFLLSVFFSCSMAIYFYDKIINEERIQGYKM